MSTWKVRTRPVGPQRLTIVHQFDRALTQGYLSGLPENVAFEALPADAPWQIPAHAHVLLPFPGRIPGGLNRQTPRPQGWPHTLQWVHLRFTGIDHLPDWLFEVPLLTVSRGGQATAISEYVLAAMLSFEKRIPEIFIGGRHEWRQISLGTLAGRTLGLVGFGHIGQAVARLGLAFGMAVMASRRSDQPSPVPGVELAPLSDILPRADHLVLAAPLTDQTRRLIGAEAMGAMKPGAHIVNVGRGAVLDTDALRDALDAGRLGGATLDVADVEPLPQGHWLYTHERVRLSPHVSHSAPSTEGQVTGLFLDNLKRYLAGERETLHGAISRQAGY